MRIKVKREKVFSIRRKGVVISGFNVVDSWEGFIKLQALGYGTVIISALSDGEKVDLFQNLFDLKATDPFKEIEEEMIIVKCSNEFIKKLECNEEEEHTT